MSTELEERVKKLEARIQELEDVENIKKLQRSYGYYLEHWMAEDIIDCFCDGPEAELLVAAGQYKGKENIRDFFHHGKKGIETPYSNNPEFLHQVMQLCGVVHVDPDGLHARGRWYGFGANCFPAGDDRKQLNPGWMNGVYEVDYIKQNGVWRLRKVRWCMTMLSPYTTSWVPPERLQVEIIDRPYKTNPELKPVKAPEETLWPSGFICPFHYPNPATGRKTLVEE